ncbi:MAG: MarR family transcriptional regulator [Propionibacteriaceae bacterium]
MTPAVHILDRLIEITMLFQQDMARAFATNGLTLSRTHLLWELQRLGPSTQQALAGALNVSARNITGLVDALVTTGFVSRTPHPTDRRAVLVTLTDLGTQTLTTMAQDRVELSEQLVSELDVDGVEQLAAGLDAITARLRSLVDATAEQPEQPEL